MYNYFMLIGFVVNELELRDVGDGKKVVNIRLAVKREFQNTNGEYDIDYINVSAWDFLAEHAYKYVKKGSRIGLKGRIRPRKEEKNEAVQFTNELYADRVLFLGDNGPKDLEDVYSEEE